MKQFSRFVLATSFAVGFICTAAAQDQPLSSMNVLQITREYVKPGKNGPAHDKTESAFVEAMRKAKWPTYYIAVTSLSGKSRALFLTWYQSFDAWQKDGDAAQKNAVLTTSLDRAAAADGELLDSMDQMVLYFRDDMSLNTKKDLQDMRYLEALVFHVKPGKEKDWEQVVNIAKEGYAKAIPSSHWGMYQLTYGGDPGDYVLFVAHKSLDEVDKGFADGKKFEDAMGEEGMKKFNELYASCVDTNEQQLFAVNPAMSYVSDEWIKASPDFWKPKVPIMSAKATEEKKPKP
jgi:hypothetical protein